MKNSESSSTSIKAIKVQYTAAVENFRRCWLECLKMDFKPVLDNLEEIKTYAKELTFFSTDLRCLCDFNSAENRFKKLQYLCRTGNTMMFFPEHAEDIEEGEVVILMYQDEEFMGTLTDKDLYF